MTRISSKLLFLLLASALASKVIASGAELYWIANSDDEITILSSVLTTKGDVWSDPKSIYQAESELHSLAIATSVDGGKTMVWTERRQQRMVLMKMQLAAGSTTWGQASIFNDTFAENFAATLVTDANNQLWLFWSANKGGLDDVYLSKRGASGWSSPVRIHAENKVPDVTPSAYLDAESNVVVEWNSYDYVVDDYITLSKIYEAEISGSDKVGELNQEPDLNLSLLRIPSSLPNKSFGIAHFPNNKFRQSERIANDF